MSKPILFLYVTFILILATVADKDSMRTQQILNRRNILKNVLETSNMKTLFKVYHFVFNKAYDYNTEEGIEKYKVFRANVQEIQRHNANPHATYKKGFNHLTDMTGDQVKAYYNLKPISVQEIERKMRNLRTVSLDDFNDDNEAKPEEKAVVVDPQQLEISYAEYMRPVKNQGACGSCWAFGTISALETAWGKLKSQRLDYDLSEQFLVDCDLTNGGCGGGWYDKSFNFIKSRGTIKADDYPYEATRATCRETEKTKTEVFVKGFKYSYTPDRVMADIQLGPLGAAVDANSDFYAYESGVWNAPCTATKVNHAVHLYGYSAAEQAWLVRNSWGSAWGEGGNIKILSQGTANNCSCYIGRYGFRPLFV